VGKRVERKHRQAERERLKQDALMICSYCGWPKGTHSGTCAAPLSPDRKET